MSALALDIGTYTIKIIAGNPGDHPKITKIAEIFNSTGVAVPTDDGAMEKLSGLLKTVFNDYKLATNGVRLSLPETVVSTKVIAIPPLSDAELASAVGWQAEQHIPIPPEELALEYEVLYRPEKKDQEPMRVLLIGVRKRIVERYVGLFNNLGIEPTIIETQMMSVLRSLAFERTDPTTLVIHLGSSSMDQCIVYQGEPQFITSHLNGGQLLTRTLEQSLGLDSNQAEQYKRTYGLDETQFQGKVRDALLPAVKLLISEANKTVKFFVNQHPQEKLQRVVLSGGTAQLPGLVQLVTEELGAEVLVTAPFTDVSGSIPDDINHPSMSVCMGLLRRE